MADEWARWGTLDTRPNEDNILVLMVQETVKVIEGASNVGLRDF